VRQAKKSVVSDLSRTIKNPQRIKSYYSLGNPKDSSLFFCLAALAKEFLEHDYDADYVEGFERICFDRCIEIIEEHLI
jgi:hypothetical protein